MPNIHEKINYVEFPARDMAAVKKFFEDVFGWTFTDYGDEYSAFSGAGLEGGFYHADMAASSEVGGALVVLYSDSLEKTMDKIQQGGGTIVKPIFAFPGGRRFHFADPCGNEYACLLPNIHEKINYVEFPARDMAVVKKFFENVFGWMFTDYGDEYTAFSGAGLEGGFYHADMAASSEVGGALVVLYSDVLEKTIDKIQQGGGTIVKPLFDFPGGRRFHFADPCGNEYAVWSANRVSMKKVYIYWDNSNIFIEAQRLAEKQNGTPDARDRVRINFENLLNLARADRKIGRVIVAGSVVLPAMRQLWNRIEETGAKVERFERMESRHGEQEVPDRILQLRMMENGVDNIETPGIVVLLTGDGAGYSQGSGFHRTLERLHKIGWQVEVLSWDHSCKRQMREWAKQNGIFIALDDFYNSITFLESSDPSLARDSAPLDLSKRATI